MSVGVQDKEQLKRLMLLMHKYESTQDVMANSSLVDAPHCPPCLRRDQPSCNYGHSCTTLHTPGAVAAKEPPDPWADTMTETVSEWYWCLWL